MSSNLYRNQHISFLAPLLPPHLPDPFNQALGGRAAGEDPQGGPGGGLGRGPRGFESADNRGVPGWFRGSLTQKSGGVS